MKYSVVTSVFNDSYLAENFCKTFENMLREDLGVKDQNDYELIIVNDGSTDDTLFKLIELKKSTQV